MGHSSICKLICAINVCNIDVLTVGVHLSSTPSIRGPGSATVHAENKLAKKYLRQQQRMQEVSRVVGHCMTP